MGCGSGGCSSGGCGAKSSGNKGCSTGGCNRLNVYNWLSDLSYGGEHNRFPIVEVSFNNGSRKDFYRNIYNIPCLTGDYVVLETPMGMDVGTVSLTGELVRLQLKKRKLKEDSDKITRLMRIASESDMAIFRQAKSKEAETLLMGRVILRDLGINMKLSEVEFQGDDKKATFYYTAEERVDFRELIKMYAREFKVKIEMRQIGTRQEAGKVGGMGACGRELCCSTWLSDFKSVNTQAARYQQLAINQSKLSGQCGRLKCCLNYELDTYVDALRVFPDNAEVLELTNGKAKLAKTDVFRQKMHYFLPESGGIVVLDIDKVKEVLNMNQKGEKPAELESNPPASRKDQFKDYEDTVGQSSLSSLERTAKRQKQKIKPIDRDNNTSLDKSPENSPLKDDSQNPRFPKNISNSSEIKKKTGQLPQNQVNRPPKNLTPSPLSDIRQEVTPKREATPAQNTPNTRPPGNSRRNKNNRNSGKPNRSDAAKNDKNFIPPSPKNPDDAPKE